MEGRDSHRLGYRRVDEDPNVAVLLATMSATADLVAVRRLREWERAGLELRSGQRLLDVGCGLGDAALALAQDLAPDGEIVGIDRSAEMVRAARINACDERARVRFDVGDARHLDEPDDSFDAVRCERTLQWLVDPAAAVSEIVRVLRPSGRVSLIDTDWSTFTIDVGDSGIADMVRDAMSIERARPSHVGRRLGDLLAGVGVDIVGVESATQVWLSWDPDTTPAPDGCFSMRSLAEDLVATGHLLATESELFIATIHDAARSDNFRMTLTMHAVIGTQRANKS